MDTPLAFAGLMLAALLPVLIPALVVLVVSIVGRWKLISRLGGRGWAALVPFFCDWELSRTTGAGEKCGWAIVVLEGIACLAAKKGGIVGAIGIIAGILALVLVGYSFWAFSNRCGHGIPLAVGCALVPVVFQTWAAFADLDVADDDGSLDLLNVLGNRSANVSTAGEEDAKLDASEDEE
ncbi:MAG: hypothetical protein Q4B30_06865 [Coriobacteriaceae bacterium]|nr:hypothetical protein [Coriobacteriaceae bacterium]